jgi:hypothetical protein
MSLSAARYSLNGHYRKKETLNLTMSDQTGTCHDYRLHTRREQMKQMKENNISHKINHVNHIKTLKGQD